MVEYTKEVKKIKNSTTITCIVPAWNEGKYIKQVLDVVTTFPHFDEVLVVDDGSEDNTSEVAKQYKKIKVLKHKENKGKTAAVLTGMKNSKGKLVTLIDADLIGLTHENMAKMIYLVLNKDYDMAILDRQGDREAVWGWTNCARFVGGERTFWRKEFDKIDEIPKVTGYLIEMVMNLYYMEHNKKIKTVYCENLYTVHQYNKFGKLKGYYNYMKVAKKYLEKATIRGYLKQVKYIEDEHKEITDLKRKTRRKELKERITNKFKKNIGKNKYKELKKKANEKVKKMEFPKRIKKFRKYIQSKFKNKYENSSKKS